MLEDYISFIIIGILISLIVLLIFNPNKSKIFTTSKEYVNKIDNSIKNTNMELENSHNIKYQLLGFSYCIEENMMTKSNAEKFIKKLESIRENHPELKNFFDKLNR